MELSAKAEHPPLNPEADFNFIVRLTRSMSTCASVQINSW